MTGAPALSLYTIINTKCVTIVYSHSRTARAIEDQLPFTCCIAMEDYDDIFRFCEGRGYPAKLTDPEKRNFRRKCKENFKVDGGQLYYKRSDRGTQSLSERPWKLCIKTTEEKERVLKSCHSSATGIWKFLLVYTSAHTHTHTNKLIQA